MQGLLERLDFGAMLLSRAGREASDAPFDFHSEKLSKEIGYARFGKFKKEEVDELDKTLARFSDESKMRTLILDLRSPQALADFEIASLILGRFRPAGELLFKIRRPNEDRARLFTSRSAAKVWDREIIVLIDRETGNAGEIIAAVLRDRNGSLLIGETTIGMTVEYRDVPVAEDRILRYAANRRRPGMLHPRNPRRTAYCSADRNRRHSRSGQSTQPHTGLRLPRPPA
jgi:C-terminal processing protease CtpA/Prc